MKIRSAATGGQVAWEKDKMEPGKRTGTFCALDEISIRLLAAALTALLATIIALVGSAAPAWAAEEHNFDPSLSLTGGTVVSAQDPVPDPGSIHPPLPFSNPCGTAVDRHGDIYVASSAVEEEEGTKGRIDVFNPQGEYITEILNQNQPCSLGVDAEGNLYAAEYQLTDTEIPNHKLKKITLYKPNIYPPVAGTEYSKGTLEQASGCPEAWSLAVDPSNDHLYVASGGSCIVEYDSAANGSGVIREDIGKGLGTDLSGVSVCGKNHDVYVSGVRQGSLGDKSADGRVFVFDGATGEKKVEIDGSETPDGGFGFIFGKAGVAVDQANCDVYVDDAREHHVVDQFTAEGVFIGQLPQPSPLRPTPFAGLAVDDPIVKGEAGYNSPREGYVYLTSGLKSNNSHLFAFEPKSGPLPPSVEEQTASGVTESEAVLEAKLNPEGLVTRYHFEYIGEADFLENGYANATRVPAPDVDAGAGGFPITVTQPVAGLLAGTTYHFRLVATSHCDAGEPAKKGVTAGEGKPGEEGTDATFTSYSSPGRPPEGRVYELVTPPDTNGRIPTAAEVGSSFNPGGNGFPSSLIVANGQSASIVFGTEGGSLPGTEASGYHDTYEARRGPSGWQSSFTGLSGAQAQEPFPGGIAADHGFAFWEAAGAKGKFALGAPGVNASYLRALNSAVNPACAPPSEPQGRFEFIGCGSLGIEPFAIGKWISAGGKHVIFTTKQNNGAASAQLEPCAPPTGTGAVYDRTPGGITHCVSLLPGEETPPAGTHSFFEGASSDGSVVLFKTNDFSQLGPSPTSPLYARLDNTKSVEIAEGETALVGVSQDGGRIVYLHLKEPIDAEGIPSGEIFGYDTATGETKKAESGGESVVVNVSADGSRIYFVSSKQLDSGSEAGAMNLYVWDGSTVRFIAMLTSLDVIGEEGSAGQTKVGGLGLWATYGFSAHFNPHTGPAVDPSRSTPDGRAFVFQSHANLTEYDSGGHSEVYRYIEGGGVLCLSCNPTGAPATSDAQLQSNPGAQLQPFPPVNALTPVANVTVDGQRVFFQSADRLVLGDVDEKVDVYEWSAGGTSGCNAVKGCIFLISSGHSAGDDYLYAATPDGHDVFFESSDQLTAQDIDGTPSIYDARTGGGFPAEVQQVVCQEGETCRPPPTPVPSLPDGFNGPFSKESAKGPSRCARGAHSVRRGARIRCVKHGGRRKHHRGRASR